MEFCTLRQAVLFLACGENGGDATEELLKEASERFVYLLNHEFGTGISVFLRGSREHGGEKVKIDLIYLKNIDPIENRALVREYRIVPVNDVFSDEELRERVCETPFFDVEVDLEALKKLSEHLEGRVYLGEKRIISIRENPEYADKAIEYFQTNSGFDGAPDFYENVIRNCIKAETPFPQWYLLYGGGEVTGGVGLVLNDFISRFDLYPWLSMLSVNETARGNGYGFALIDRAKKDAKAAGIPFLYAAASEKGFFERAGFDHMADGYALNGEVRHIYKIETVCF